MMLISDWNGLIVDQNKNSWNSLQHTWV